MTDTDGAEATSPVTIPVEEFSGYCGSAYPYEHENNGCAVSNADGSTSAVGSGDDLGYGGPQVTLEETSENDFENVNSCDGGGDDGGDDWSW